MLTPSPCCCSLRLRLGLVALALSVFTSACQRVPLLAPTGSTITLTASATTLPVNGVTDIIAQVLEAAGTPPHLGTSVTFTTTLGTVQPSEAETDTAGRVIVKFLAGATSGTATIRAISGGSSVPADGAVKILVGGAAVETVVLTASSPSVSPAGGTVTLTASAVDLSGNRLPGVPVTFTTTAGQLTAPVVNTDQNGDAVTTLTTSRETTISAAAGSKKSADLKITLNAGPSVSFGTIAPASPVAGQPVTFPITVAAPAANGAAVRSVVVEFGDGTQPTSAGTVTTSLVHTFANPQTYTVIATATDVNGERGSASVQVSIGLRPLPTITITASPTSAQVGQPVTFTVTPAIPTGSTAIVQSVSIDFGDGVVQPLGTLASATTVQHAYQTSGNFTARATILDSGGGLATQSTGVVVTRPLPTVTISASNTGSGSPTVGQPVSFTVVASIPQISTNPPQPGAATIQSVTLEFGDGQSTSLGSPASGQTLTAQHVYQRSSAYTATATVRDSAGGVGSASTTVVVVERSPLTVSVTVNPTNPAPNTPVTFAITLAFSSNAAPTATVVVDFGDGQKQTYPGNTTSVQHVYTSPGSYTMTATVTDTNGASGSGSVAFTVLPPAPSASFTANPNPGKAGQQVFFNASLSTGDIKTYTFDYGDGGSDSSSSPTQTHVYNLPSTLGGYTVTLTVIDSQGRSNSTSKPVTINP